MSPSQRPPRPSPDPRTLLGDRADEVSPLELFFDLVFVFAVSQLSEHLVGDLSWRGAAETLVLLAAVFGIWSFTSWGVSFPQGGRAEAGSIFVVLFVALFLNALIPHAFSEEGWVFGVLFMICSFGQTIFAFVTAGADWLRAHYRSMLVWGGVESVFWIIGALASPELRLAWWAVAAALNIGGSWAAHPVPGRRFHSNEVPFEPSRMVERSRLLLLIALGETVLTIGTAIAKAELTPASVITAVLALVTTTALWFLYFSGPDAVINQSAESASDRLRVARIAVNTQLVILAGLISVAVANEVAIEHPVGERTTVALSLVMNAGPVLYLAAQTWYLHALIGSWSRPRLIGIAVLILVAAASPLVSPLVALAATTTVVTVVAAARRMPRTSKKAPAKNPSSP